jgi:hypothetical protein
MIAPCAELRPRKLLPWEGMPLLILSLITTQFTVADDNSYSTLTSSIITLVVGREQRLFAAHEDVLCISPFFQAACRGQFMEASSKRISLPDEEPEIFSSVLEYLYKGDYYPRLVHNKRRNSWELESGEGGTGSVESTVYHHGVDGELLKDTVIYCTAEKYGLEELKRVALRKQGLRMFLVSFNTLQILIYFKYRIWNPMQHNPLFCPLCLCKHTRHRLQAPSTLPRSHHPQQRNIQA